MKKTALILTALFSVSAAQALDTQSFHMENGKQYIELNTPESVQPEVVEFFSFYCPHCYNFEYQYDIPEKVKASLPKGVAFKQYHVEFLGPQGKLLTRAWSLALALGVENKVRKPLFDAVREAVAKREEGQPNLETIRKIFLDAGVPEEEFNGINSFVVTALMNKQIKLAEKLDIHGVPDFYVDGKYRVNPEGQPKTEQGFVDGYIKTINALLQKREKVGLMPTDLK